MDALISSLNNLLSIFKEEPNFEKQKEVSFDILVLQIGLFVFFIIHGI